MAWRISASLRNLHHVHSKVTWGFAQGVTAPAGGVSALATRFSLAELSLFGMRCFEPRIGDGNTQAFPDSSGFHHEFPSVICYDVVLLRRYWEAPMLSSLTSG